MDVDGRSILERSEAQFRLLVQGVTDYAIYMLSPDGTVSSWNAGAQRIKGYAPEEIIGQNFSRFYTPEDQQQKLPEMGLAIAAREGRFEKEGWRVRKDGSRFLAHVVIDAIRSEDGQLIGFAKITRDITERQRSQEALQSAQHALFQSQKLESIGQLTGGIAHDFNNLLTVIIASLELLQSRVRGDEKSLLLVQNAMHGAERGATLTQRMLAFARRQELTIEAVDLNGLLRGMMDLVQRAIGGEIRIEYEVAQSLPRVRADPNQLEAAILNLVVNARDAMDGRGSITIGAHEETAPHPHNPVGASDYVCLWVKDTGHGMDAETMQRAKEPFFTTKGVGKGTGLGLSMVHGLAEQFGGTTRIASTRGEGTTVTIELPVATGESAQSSAAPAPAPATNHAADETTRVLLVDDDVLVLTSSAALLEAHGFHVVQASNGIDALKAITQQQFDVVVTDQMMPEMTGLQLARAIEALYPDMPIILASGYAEIPEGLPAKVMRLAKPFRAAELLGMIARVLQNVAAPQS